MLTVFWILLWAGPATLVVAAGLRLRRRRREAVAWTVPAVDDAAVERILATGRLAIPDARPPALEVMDEGEGEDEPSDRERIDEEEERFWSESWDEPTEW